MKYLFCDDLNNKHSDESREHWAESVFLSAEAPDDRKAEVEKAEKGIRKAESSKSWHSYIPNVARVALFAGIILALAVIYEIAANGSSIGAVYQSRPWFFWAAGCAFIIAGAAYLLSRSLAENPLSDKKRKEALKQFDAAEQQLADSLGVPDDAVKADILKFTYEEKESRLDILFIGEYLEVDMFARDGSLCVFDGKDLFAFPKKEMLGIKVQDKEVSVGNWNKPEPQESERFRKYGVRPQLGLKYFCTLDLTRGGEKYSLLFPAYELGIIQILTGLDAPRLPSGASKSASAKPGSSKPGAGKSASARPGAGKSASARPGAGKKGKR